ncbi:MAG: hypothetical protein ACE3L7_12675 [Candidatus Pristimantibacillus sp.]
MTYKGMITIFVAVLCLSIVSACQSNDQSKNLKNQKITMVKLLVCTQQCQQREDKPFVEYEFKEKAAIAVYTKAIDAANAMEGELDYGAEFEMILYYKDQSTQHFHLSLGKSKGEMGLLVPLSNTRQGYRIEVKEADQLRDLIWAEIGD